MDYNTQREKLVLPEYGRHVQKMIDHIKLIEDRDKRNEQIQAVVNVMTILNPSLKDYPDYKRKLWDHVYMIAGYDIDIDSPYPAPTPAEKAARPEPIEINKTQIKSTVYGRNIENMIELVAGIEDETVRTEMIKNLARYMRQQYLIWNKDNVADETIFKDMAALSRGRLAIPEGMSLGAVHGEFNRPRAAMDSSQQGKNYQQFSKKKNNKRKRFYN